ncbi:unnamed protein product [Caenorhabditis sp. 36 PRJEB53466]|nr:unnamed protein product [Caenorhabditis sp. 36 PRJEB53466]
MDVDNAGAGNVQDEHNRSSPKSRRTRRSAVNVTRCSTRMNQRSFSNFWSVENFSVQLELHTPSEFMMAPKFGDADYEFVMKLFPNGKDEDTAGYLSLFLLINKCPNPRLRFRVSFTVETADGPRSCHLNKNLVTINRSGIVTASKFFSLDILKTAPSVYIPNDVLTIGCDLTIYAEPVTMTTKLSPYSRGNASLLRASFSANGQSSSNSSIHSLPVDQIDPECGDGFLELLSSGEFSDFTVVSSDGREFAVHMCVLSSRSEYFKALLRNKGTKEYQEKTVTFEDMSAETIEIVLNHIYTDRTEHVPLEEHHLTSELICAVDRLMISSLVRDIADILNTNITKENVVSRIGMAAQLRLHETYGTLLNFFADNSKDCLESQEWSDLKVEQQGLTIKILEDALLITDPRESGLDRRIADRIITLS